MLQDYKLGRWMLLKYPGLSALGIFSLVSVGVSRRTREIGQHTGPSGRPADDLPLITVNLAITAVVMLAACLLACIGPAGRALRINPTEALRQQ